MHLLALLRLFFYALKMGGRFTRPAPLLSLLCLLTLPCRLWVSAQRHCPNYSNSLQNCDWNFRVNQISSIASARILQHKADSILEILPACRFGID